MRERGAVGTRYLAVVESFAPGQTPLALGVCPGKLLDGDAVAFVERLVRPLRRLTVPPGKVGGNAVQCAVNAAGRCDAQLGEKIAQFRCRKTRADDRAMLERGVASLRIAAPWFFLAAGLA